MGSLIVNNGSDGVEGDRVAELDLQESKETKILRHLRSRHNSLVEPYTINPLLVDLVFRKVLQYTTLQSLYQCRLACREWAIEAWNHIMGRKVLQFTKDNVSDLCKFSSSFSTTRFSSPTKLAFQGFVVANHRSELQSLFSLVGPAVKDLTLHFRDDEISLEELGMIFLRNMPNLEYLTLSSLPCNIFQSVYDVDLEIRVPKLINLRSMKLGTRCHYTAVETSDIFFRHVLNLAPNLAKLEGAVEFCVPNLVKAIDAVQLPRLTHLVLRGAFNETTARTLEKFQLETFYLGVPGHYNDDYRHNVVCQQRNTLRTLGLGWSSFQTRIHLENMRNDFPKLTYLNLCDSSKWICDSCPEKYVTGEGIKKLRADIRKPDDFYYLQGYPNNFLSVRELDISFLNRSVQARLSEILISTRALFPNVKILTVHIAYGFDLGLLFNLFGSLEELSLLFSAGSTNTPLRNLKFLDTYFVGVDEETCNVLRCDDTFLNQEALKERYDPQLQEYEGAAGLTGRPLSYLTNLRKLTVNGDGALISHVTVQLCLLKMQTLTAICIEPCTPTVLLHLKHAFSPGVFLDIQPENASSPSIENSPLMTKNDKFKLNGSNSNINSDCVD